MIDGIIVNRIPSVPPFRRGDAGKFYLRRMTDHAVLLDGDAFVFFATHAEAAAFEVDFPVEVRQVPS